MFIFVHRIKSSDVSRVSFWILFSFLTVDSVLLVTRAIVKVSAADNVKDFYSVWRRDEANPLS